MPPDCPSTTRIYRTWRIADVAKAHTHARLGIFHRGLDGYNDRRTRLRHSVMKASRTPNIRGWAFRMARALTVLILSGSVRVAVRSVLRLLRRPCPSIGNVEAAFERILELACRAFDQPVHGLCRRLQ